MSYTYKRKINYYETDKMGIVHHSNYIRFLEEARCAYLDSIDLPYDSFEAQGIMIPVLNVNCNYKYHVTYNDIIDIILDITEFTGVRMSLKYTLIDIKNQNVVMTAETKHCFTDTNLRPIALKKTFPHIYEKLNEVTINKD